MTILIATLNSAIRLMNSLRWTLFAVTALTTVGYLALAIVGGGFRRSFGASEHSPWLVVVPPAILLTFLASLLMPGNRPLLHAVAVLAVLLAGASLWLLRDSVLMGLLGLGYSGLWLAYYRLSG